jgi:hypothetical protein
MTERSVSEQPDSMERSQATKMVVVSKVNFCGVLESVIQSETGKGKPEALIGSPAARP